MELKNNLLGNYKENKIIETNNETKNFLIERDNEIFNYINKEKYYKDIRLYQKYQKQLKQKMEI